MIPQEPFNFWTMNPDEFIQRNGLVKSIKSADEIINLK